MIVNFDINRRLFSGGMKIKLILLIGLFFFSFLDEDSAKRNIMKINDSFHSYIASIHPQKIYLHLDKEVYYSNERIWFKAYLLYEPTLKPDTASDHLYVELVNPYTKVVQIIRIKGNPLHSSGSFYLGDTIPEGIYQIRAYTNWMKNFGPEYFFSKNVEIRNPNKEYLITPKEARTNQRKIKQVKKDMESFRIGFFPEGGNLLENINCRVAFKAEDLFGKGVEVTGYIADKDKNKIINFHSVHAGMGSFSIKPEKNNHYTAYVQFPDGSHKKVGLPDAVSNGVGLRLNSSPESIDIKLLSNKPHSNDRPANEFIIIGQVRSRLYYAANINLLDGDSVFRIPTTVFPSGIIHFTLFNNRLQAIAERLHFINHYDFQSFEMKRFTFQDSTKILVMPEPILQKSEIVMGSISVVIPENKKIKEPENNIITELLLTNDLPGYIENPAYYLSTKNPDVRDNVELLMLTHGWKRFLWEDVLNGTSPKIRFDMENGLTVTGKITREFFEIPLQNADVWLDILDEYNDEFHTVTDKKGWFFFDNMFYEDTVHVKIVARKASGGKNLLILLNEDPYEPVTERYGNFFLTSSSKMNMKDYNKAKAALAKEEMRMREKELDSIFQDNIYGAPDYVLWGDDIPSGYSNVLDAMQGRIPGVNITGNTVTIRGVSSFLGSSEPLILIDGVPTDMEAIRTIPVNDVERIEILKGPKAAMYGTRGANGVISIHTKRGMYLKKGEISFSMLGYHVTEHFYSPSESMISSRTNEHQMPLTLFWNPNIIITEGKYPNITFPSAKTENGYYIVFEGISNQGTIGYRYAYFKN